jgi:hypothetical protein
MLYHRFCGLESAGLLVAFEGTRRTNKAVPCDPKTLRARAAHCRSIAATFYDQGIVAELETFARELEDEASRLESSERA